MKIKLLIIALLFSVMSWGQISIPNTTPIVENFDSMAASGTAALPANWKMSPAGAAAPTWVAGGNFTAVNQQASSGAPATGARYNWGDTGAVNRALGIMTSGGYASPNSIMSYYRNTNASNLTQLTVSYNLERYRINTAAASVQFYYSLDGTTWTAVAAGDVAAASLPTGASAYNFTPGLTINVAAFNITGLNIATNSDIYLRWNLNTAGASSQGIGIDDVSVTASFTVGCTAPSTQASAVTTSGETLDGFTVNWTAGNGNGTMIVVSDAAVVAPTSGTAYTSNLAWVSAAQINTNNRVIFRGAGTSAGPITGLASGAQYSVRAYEYNTTGNCYALPGAIATGYTRALEPTAHAATFTCTTASTTQINLAFPSRATIPNARAYMILQKIGSAPTGIPTDGVIYTAGATIGDATVVGYTALDGVEVSYNVTGLTPGTNYYFTLIPLNAYLSVAVTANYNTNATIPSTNCTTNNAGNSDVVAVATSEAATISSIINNNAPLTSGTGVQVWQFKVRDGGVTLSDADALPTILTAFTLTQGGGNTVTTWSDAINTIELFDGATRIAAATVTANQIQFTGLSVSVADNTEKTLSLRMSLKCPLGADAFDGEDFVFSLSNANTTFSVAGSGKGAFPAAVSTDNQNVISVVATRLTFTTQPVTTGVNTAMSNVVVTATDACGNKDLGFTGNVVLTSTGTMTGSPITVAAVAGIATFTGIIHTVVGTGLTMNATATGLTSATSTTFNITLVTVLQRGDIAILAVNTDINVGNDQIAFVCFQDILPGTTIYLTDNGYEREFANEWGGTEGIISITRTGTTLTKGTIIVIQGVTVNPGNILNSSHFDVLTCGVVDASWTKTAISGGSVGGFNLNSDDDVWIMQGGIWTNSITHHSTYSGNVLYGWTESGWNSVPGGASQSTRWSTIFPTLECYNTVAPTGAGFVKFNDPVNPDFSTITNGKLDWIALINNTVNWDTYADNTTYAAGGYDYIGNSSCPQITVAATGYINGKWTGRADTNWFNCANWDTLVVPDATVDVQVGDNTFNRQAIVDATAPQSDYYGDLAQARNLTITGEKVEVTTALTNILEVHGNLLIDTPAGALDMNGGGATDGHLLLYGNWTNNMGTASFDEGNGTVTFTGTTPQIISNVTPEGTETFHHLILNNDFTTSVSNDIIANGDLTINATKILTVSPNDYVQVTNNVTNNGTFNIQNNGSLVQINDAGVNTGNISYARNYNVRLQD
jgi:hypothetical protein